jgi:hypothetical protein
MLPRRMHELDRPIWNALTQLQAGVAQVLDHGIYRVSPTFSPQL